MWTSEIGTNGGFLGHLQSKIRRSIRQKGPPETNPNCNASEKVEWEFICFPSTAKKWQMDSCDTPKSSPDPHQPQTELNPSSTIEKCGFLGAEQSRPPPLPPRYYN